MKDITYIEGVPVVKGTRAEEIALDFQKLIRSKGLKGVNYRTGMKCGAWSLDIYLIPENEKKPFFQAKCNGEHILHREYGFFASGEKNEIIQTIVAYMNDHQ